jgi:hypothetical protein
MGALWWNVEDILVITLALRSWGGASGPTGQVKRLAGRRNDAMSFPIYDLLGTIQAVDDFQMTVDGQVFRLTAQSVLEPGLGVGQRALVRVAIERRVPVRCLGRSLCPRHPQP